MTSSSVSFVRFEGETRGPLSLDQFRQLVEAGCVTLETEVAATAEGPWSKLREMPSYAEFFASRRHFAFQTRAFEAVNRSTQPPVDHRQLIAAANQPPPAVSPPGRPSSPSAANEVLTILQENREKEKLAGLDQLAPAPPRPNRRRIDYLILLIGGNALFFYGMFTAHGNVVQLLFSVGGAAFYTTALTWIMYGVMSRY